MRIEHKLYDVLNSNTTLTVTGIAEHLGASEETVLALLRRERVPVYVKAGALWVRGRQPSRPAPGWLATEKADR